LLAMQDLFDADPDIHYLFEHFAFLSASLRRKIEDAFPEITQSLLQKVWPLPLRYLPATLIINFETGSGGELRQIEANTVVKGYSDAGKEYNFRLCREMVITPLQL